MKHKMITLKKLLYFILIGIFLLGGMAGCTISHEDFISQDGKQSEQDVQSGLAQYGGGGQEAAYIILNDNVPSFTEEEKKSTEPFERYSALDRLGRCGVAYANICKELMPEQEREGIGQIKPSGWHTVKYESIDGKYLYNRCHLIGYQLAGENANEKNLITGTRYLNTEGMLPFENMVADYVETTANHVLYRVTPVFEGDNLVAGGVEMEAFSVEDEGEGICYHVYVYNCQPGIEIDYATGESAVKKDAAVEEQTGSKITKQGTAKQDEEQQEAHTYILNTNTKKFHLSTCESVDDIKGGHKVKTEKTKQELEAEGYSPCKRCNP